VLQVKPHAPAVQVAVLLAGVGQGVQDVPQLVGAVSGTQVPEHKW
jgi:hypothetical protein